jgi:hypothetical protein
VPILIESLPEAPNTPSLLPLGETKKALVIKLNEGIVSLLQERNYPVGFDGIKLPSVSDSGLEVKKNTNESSHIGLSEATKTRILENVARDLEAKYTPEAIQAKIDILKSQITRHQEELEQIPQQIRDLKSFKPYWQKEKNDIDEYEIRQNTLPQEITRIWDEISALWIIRPYSPELISTIIAELRVILCETMRFEEPVKIKKPSVDTDELEKTPVEISITAPAEKNQARTARLKTASAAAVILLSVATYTGTQWWNGQKENRKAKEEEVSKQKNIDSFFARYPEVKGFCERKALIWTKKITIEFLDNLREAMEILPQYHQCSTAEIDAWLMEILDDAGDMREHLAGVLDNLLLRKTSPVSTTNTISNEVTENISAKLFDVCNHNASRIFTSYIKGVNFFAQDMITLLHENNIRLGSWSISITVKPEWKGIYEITFITPRGQQYSFPLRGPKTLIPALAQNELSRIQLLLQNPIYSRSLLTTSSDVLGWVSGSARLQKPEIDIGSTELIKRPCEEGGYMEIVWVHGVIEQWSRPWYGPDKFPFFLDGDNLMEPIREHQTDTEKQAKKDFAVYTGELRNVWRDPMNEHVTGRNWVELLFGSFGKSKWIEGTLVQMLQDMIKKPNFMNDIRTHMPTWFYNLLQQQKSPLSLIPMRIAEHIEISRDVICITFMDGDCYHKISVPIPLAFQETESGLWSSVELIRNIRIDPTYPQYIPVWESGLDNASIGSIRILPWTHNQTINEISFWVSETGNNPSDALKSVTVNGIKAAVINGKVTIHGLQIPAHPDMLAVDIPVRVDYNGIGEWKTPSGTAPFLTVAGIRYTRHGESKLEENPSRDYGSHTPKNMLVRSLPHVSIQAPKQPLTTGLSPVLEVNVAIPPTGDIFISGFHIAVTEKWVKINKEGPRTPSKYFVTFNWNKIDLDPNSSYWRDNVLTLNMKPVNGRLWTMVLPRGSINKLQVFLTVDEIHPGGTLEVGFYDSATRYPNFNWYDIEPWQAWSIQNGAGYGWPQLPNFPIEPVTVK